MHIIKPNGQPLKDDIVATHTIILGSSYCRKRNSKKYNPTYLMLGYHTEKHMKQDARGTVLPIAVLTFPFFISSYSLQLDEEHCWVWVFRSSGAVFWG
jgi:hypothetical protein